MKTTRNSAGKALRDFIPQGDLIGARAIINADVKENGAKVAAYAHGFERALRAAGYGVWPSVKPVAPRLPGPAEVPLPPELQQPDDPGAKPKEAVPAHGCRTVTLLLIASVIGSLIAIPYFFGG